MPQFLGTFSSGEKVTPPLTQFPWTPKLIILTQSKRPEERELWEKPENQIDTHIGVGYHLDI